MRWGYGTDVKLLSTDDGLLVTTMVGPSPGQVRYATFNHDGSKVAAATDDCRVGSERLREPRVGRSRPGLCLWRAFLLGNGMSTCG